MDNSIGKTFAIYNSSSGLYLTHGYDVRYSRGSFMYINWVSRFMDEGCYFSVWYDMSKILKFLCQSDCEDCYFAGVVNEIKSIGLEHICFVPVDIDWHSGVECDDVIDFCMGVRLVDLV